MQVKDTRDYNLFKSLPGNRVLRKPHVRRLQEAIKANASIAKYKPILVNQNYEIIDGQHRLQALKELGLPVYYVIAPGTGLKEVQDLNSISKVWTPVDYAESYSQIGYEPYTFYLAMREAFKLNHDVLLAYISLHENTSGEGFKDGSLTAPSQNQSWELASKLMQVGTFYPRYKVRGFALAFKKIAESDDYDHDRMMNKMKLRGDTIPPLSLREDFIKELERVYNYHESTNNKVRFDYN